MKKQLLFPDYPHILHGGDYNPDQWLDTPEIIDDDFRLMELSHCGVFSVGIFSWTQLEPEEGKFTFDWLDDILDRCAKHGKKVFLATPTGARPPWMAKKYPECRRVTADGRRDEYQMRHNLCFSSELVRQKTEIIDAKLARRYGNHPAVLGWHISNELSGECFCPLCLARFYKFLEKKYHTVDELNRRIWSGFWSHRYTSFDEINPRDPAMEAIVVDWKRFNAEQIRDYLAFEKSVIRRYSGKPVTTNMMGLHTEIDYFRLAPECDFIADDCYPMWYLGEEKKVGARFSMLHDLHYSMQQKPFVMMESAPGVPNFRPYAHLRRPGELQREMLLAIGHGADGTMYFQWRKSRGGFEKFHGAVVGHDNSEDNLTFQQVADYGAHLSKLDCIAGSPRKIDAALIWDWDNSWALDKGDYTHNFKEVHPFFLRHYKALWESNFSLGVVESTGDFSPYRVLVAPMLFMVKSGIREKLEAFVRNGGTLIVTQMFGYVNEDSLCYRPADLTPLTGVEVLDYDCMEPTRTQSALFNGKVVKITEAAELLRNHSAEVLATYQEDFYAGTPAVTRHALGQGSVYYLAANFEDEFLQEFYFDALTKAGIAPQLENLPSNVKCAVREGENERYLFLYNFGENEETFPVPAAYDLWNDRTVDGKLTLAPRGSTVLRIK
ncbi:MAG: beta-galactosidase [Victivallaceae bacterium]|nr:beta-galactosidase [Victivallaceae bacterium]